MIITYMVLSFVFSQQFLITIYLLDLLQEIGDRDIKMNVFFALFLGITESALWPVAILLNIVLAILVRRIKK